jgi:hypothetical protein
MKLLIDGALTNKKKQINLIVIHKLVRVEVSG